MEENADIQDGTRKKGGVWGGGRGGSSPADDKEERPGRGLHNRSATAGEVLLETVQEPKKNVSVPRSPQPRNLVWFFYAQILCMILYKCALPTRLSDHPARKTRKGCRVVNSVSG